VIAVDEVLRLFVEGTPIPQGSKTAYVVGKRAVIVDANKDALKPWRDRIRAAAEVHFRGPRLEDVAVVVIAEFRMPRPKSVKRIYPHVKPDVDKLLRAVLDALTDAGVWKDDGQVVSATPSKVYSDRPGVLVRVGRHTPNREKEIA
jgi:Holliday junction resolvase RusA-like endonuclease